MFSHACPRAVRRRLRVPFVALLAAAALSGCASRKREPLAAEALRDALADPWAQAPAVERADGIDLAEAERVALVLNPSLRAARLKARIPAEGALRAGRLDDPELDIDVMRIVEGVEQPWILGSAVAFTLPLSGRLGAEKAKANAEGRAALVEAWIAERETVRDLRRAWAEWTEASASVAIVDGTRARLDEIARIADRLAEEGELTNAEAGAFRIALAEHAIEVATLSAAERERRAGILRLMGLLPDAPATLASGGRTAVAVDADLSAVDVERLAPEVQLRRAEYDVAEEALQLEIRRQYPDLRLAPAYGREDGMDRLGGGLSVPLPIFDGNRRAIAEADATRAAARAAWEDSVQRAACDAAAARLRLVAAGERLAAVRDTLLPVAERRLADARRLVDLGEFNTLVLVDAVEADERARLSLVAAERDAALAAADLAFFAHSEPIAPSAETAP